MSNNTGLCKVAVEGLRVLGLLGGGGQVPPVISEVETRGRTKNGRGEVTFSLL